MLLDTYAWIEYFLGSKKGKKVKRMLKEAECFTSAISLAEISYWLAKNKSNQEKLSLVKNFSTVLSLDNDLLEAAGRISYQKKQDIKDFGLIDAIILATSKAYGLPVVTGDKHFEKEEGTIML